MIFLIFFVRPDFGFVNADFSGPRHKFSKVFELSSTRPALTCLQAVFFRIYTAAKWWVVLLRVDTRLEG